MKGCCEFFTAPFGKRSWKMFYCTLRDPLVMYLHKDERGFHKNQVSWHGLKVNSISNRSEFSYSSLTMFTMPSEFTMRWQPGPTTTPKSSTFFDYRRQINQNISSKPAILKSCNRGLIQSTLFVPHFQHRRSKVIWTLLKALNELCLIKLICRWCWKSKTLSATALAMLAVETNACKFSTLKFSLMKFKLFSSASENS